VKIYTAENFIEVAIGFAKVIAEESSELREVSPKSTGSKKSFVSGRSIGKYLTKCYMPDLSFTGQY